jgi:thiosulfate/3-mercaptopyruvate sulfurtransferase
MAIVDNLMISHDPAYRLLDARSSERYHGLNETIDPFAGHIPAAISAPSTANLEPYGSFKSPAALRQMPGCNRVTSSRKSAA